MALASSNPFQTKYWSLTVAVLTERQFILNSYATSISVFLKYSCGQPDENFLEVNDVNNTRSKLSISEYYLGILTSIILIFSPRGGLRHVGADFQSV